MLEGRIDAVVLSVDSAQRENKIEIVEGIVSGSPVRPEMPNSEEKHCYPLAYVTVNAEANEIVTGDIQNVVGLTPTPYVTGILETTNVDNLYSSWETKFNEWFEGVQSTLDGDTVGNLLNEINSVKNELKNKEDKISLESETLIFTESVEKVFINPHVKKILVTCVGPGGNGGMNKSYTYNSTSIGYSCGGGGGAGDLVIQELEPPLSNSYIDITINGSVSSFGAYVSAICGQAGYDGVGGNSPGMGGGGGGFVSCGHGSYAGNIIDLILERRSQSTKNRSSGGCGGTYGGGGGGGFVSIGECLLSQEVLDKIIANLSISGGNGGRYGGGGGSGMLSISGDNWGSSELFYSQTIYGTGGEYGGNGFSLKNATIIPSNSNLIVTSIVKSPEQNGTNTLFTDSEFKGEGLAGEYKNIDRVDYYGSGSYSNYRQYNSFSLSAGTGGGGYGGNGGDYVYEYTLESGYNSSYINQALIEAKKRFHAGTGGGGYGGNGGTHNIKATIKSGNYNINDTSTGGTGGGGYGHDGSSGSLYSSIAGYGGGGYGPDNYGGGGNSASYSYGSSSSGSPGNYGVVIVQLIYDEEEETT